MSITDRVREMAGFAPKPVDDTANSEGGEQEPEPLVKMDVSLDDAFHILQNERRRLVIQRISALDVGETIELRDLSKLITAAEENVAPADVPSDRRKSVYISLYQNHVDTLDDAGAVSRDGSHTITRGSETEAFAELLDHAAALKRGDV